MRRKRLLASAEAYNGEDASVGQYLPTSSNNKQLNPISGVPIDWKFTNSKVMDESGSPHSFEASPTSPHTGSMIALSGEGLGGGRCDSDSPMIETPKAPRGTVAPRLVSGIGWFEDLAAMFSNAQDFFRRLPFFIFLSFPFYPTWLR